MHLILLSGGSGKRLWPLSNDSRSKQFLKVLTDSSGSPSSMLQRVWGQLETVGLQDRAHIVASKAQVDMIESQLGEDVPLIVEPERRDTFAAIAFATLYLADRKGLGDEEVVAALPIDPFVDDAFFQQIVGLEQDLIAEDAELAMMGVRPTEPTSKLGYIRPEKSTSDALLRTTASLGGQAYLRVREFVEKPPYEVACSLIEEGALWNCGVFAFRIGYMRFVLQQNGYPTNYIELRDHFQDMPKRSFDYVVAEHAHKRIVRPYSGGWRDLGTWGTLTEEVDKEFVGQGVAIACEDVHVINELGIPVIAMGLHDMIIVAASDGILIADKEHSEQLKDVIAPFEGRPMFEERRWGSYRVLDYRKLDDNTKVLTRWVELHEGEHLTYQRHVHRSELWTFVQGEGEFALDNRIIPVSAGDVIRVSQNQWHAVRALTALRFIEVQRGDEITEEDTIRRFQTWEEVQEHCRVAAI